MQRSRRSGRICGGVGLQPGRQTSGRLRAIQGRSHLGRGQPRDRRPPGRPDSSISQCLAFSPDGKRLATGGIEGWCELWDTATGQKVQTFKGHLGASPTLAFSPDGTRLGHRGRRRHAAALGHRRASGTPLPFPGPSRVAVSRPRHQSQRSEPQPDGRSLLAGVLRGQRKIGPVLGHRDGQMRCGPIELPQGWIRHAWTADGKRLYIADSEKTIHVVESRPGKVIRTFPVDAETESLRRCRSVPMRNGSLTPARAARSGCGMPGPAQYPARSGGSAATQGALGVQSGRLALARGRRIGALKIWDIATGREIAATTLPGVYIKTSSSARREALWPSGASPPR